MAWKKGTSGNPKGRPRGQTVREYLRSALAEADPDSPGRSRFERWARALIDEAERGGLDKLDVLRWLEGTTPPDLPPEHDDDERRPRIVLPEARPRPKRAGRSETPGGARKPKPAP